MGARLMTVVLMRWSHVSDRAFRVLSRMATTALDEPANGHPAELYFAGRDLLAMSLREPFPVGDDDASVKAREYQHKRVQKAIKELIETGAIERSGVARHGRNQAYRLTLFGEVRVAPREPSRRGGLRQPVSRGATTAPLEEFEGCCDGPLQGCCDGPLRGAATAPSGGLPQHPLGGMRRSEELLEEEEADLCTDVTGSRARAPQDQISTLTDRPTGDPPNGVRLDPTNARLMARAIAARGQPAPRAVPPPLAADPPRAGPPGTAADQDVWMSKPRRGLDYHRIAAAGRTGCDRGTLAGGGTLTVAEAADFDAKPCPRCWPPPTTQEKP